eukprot:692335-Pleurochrysis_carterae.AAC.1
MATPPTSSIELEMSVDSVVVTGATIARTSLVMRCVKSPVRIPSKNAMSWMITERKSVLRTETVILRPIKLKQSERTPPRKPRAIEQAM